MSTKKRPNIWTRERREKAEKLLGTMSVEGVAEAIGVSTAALKAACYRNNWTYAYKRQPYSMLTQEQKDYIEEWAGIKRPREMSEVLGIGAAKIRGYARYKGFSIRVKPYYSESLVTTSEDKQLMKALHLEGLAIKVIAEKFEVSPEYCHEICRQ